MWQEREREWELTSGALLFHWCTITSRPLTHTHTHEFPLSCQISSCLTAFCASGVLHREYQMWNVEKSLKHAVSHKQRDHQSVSTDWLLTHTHTHTHTHSPPQCVPFKIDAHGEEEWVPPLWKSWSLCVCVCVCVFCPCWFWGCTACGKITA